MFRFIIALALVAATVAFAPARMNANRAQMQMSAESLQAKISRALGVAAMGIALSGPVLGPVPNANADGAVHGQQRGHNGGSGADVDEHRI